MTVQISKRLRRAIEEMPLRHFQVAGLAGLHPATLSKVLHGMTRLRRWDRRVLAIAEVVGVPPEEAFEPDEDADDAR